MTSSSTSSAVVGKSPPPPPPPPATTGNGDDYNNRATKKHTTDESSSSSLQTTPMSSTTIPPPTTTTTATNTTTSTAAPAAAGSDGTGLEEPTAATMTRLLSPLHRDACLRILHLSTPSSLSSSPSSSNRLHQNKKDTSAHTIWEQTIVPQLQDIHSRMLQRYSPEQHFAISQSIWMGSFLFLKLYANYELYQHHEVIWTYTNVLPPPPTMVYHDFVRLYEQLSSVQPSSILTAARFLREEPHCLSSLTHGNASLQQFCTTSLDKLIGKTRFLLECYQDWKRVWDVNNAKFVVPLPTIEYPNQDEPLVEANAVPQMQRLGWKLACLRSPHPSSRRSRLIASCASTVIVSALYDATVEQPPDDPYLYHHPSTSTSTSRPSQQAQSSTTTTTTSSHTKTAPDKTASTIADQATAAPTPAVTTAAATVPASSSSTAGVSAETAVAGPPPPKKPRLLQSTSSSTSSIHRLVSALRNPPSKQSSWTPPGMLPPPPPTSTHTTTNIDPPITSEEVGKEVFLTTQLLWQQTATTILKSSAPTTTVADDADASSKVDQEEVIGTTTTSAPETSHVPSWMRDMELTPFEEEEKPNDTTKNQNQQLSSQSETTTATTPTTDSSTNPPRTVLVTVHQVVEQLHNTIEQLYHETILQPQYHNDDGFIYDEATLVTLDSLQALQDLSTETLFQQMIQHRDHERDQRATPTSTATPPTYSEVMDVNEWTVALLYLDIVQPSSHLHHMIEAHAPRTEGSNDHGYTTTTPTSMWKYIVPILNRIVLRLSQQFMTSKPTRFAPVVIEEYGKVTIVGEVTPDKQLLKAIVGMYYHGLEAILFCEMLRLQSMPEYRDRAMKLVKTQMVCHPPFHAALMACSITCVTKAVGVTQKIAIHTLSAFNICQCTPHDFVLVSELFQRTLTGQNPASGHMGSPLMFAVPRLLGKEVEHVERHVMNVALWMDPPQRTSTQPKPFVEVIEDLRDLDYWPPECLVGTASDDGDDKNSTSPPEVPEKSAHYNDFCNLSSIFRRVFKLAHGRMVELLQFLGVRRHFVVARYSLEALRYLMRKHINMLTNRHLDHMVLCCLYGVSKILQCVPEVTFVKLIEAYVVVLGRADGDVTCQRVIRNVILSTEYDDDGNDVDADNGGPEQNDDLPPIGNIIQLYNQVFVPKMKDFLLNSSTIRNGIFELEHEGDDTFDAAIDPLDPRCQQRFGSTNIRVAIRNDPGRAVQDRLKAGGSVTIMEFGKPSEQTLKQANDAIC